MEVAVDADHINSVSMTPLSDSVETMYPLMAPALEQLSEQICSSQSLENLTYQREASIHALPWSRPSNPAF